MRRRRGAAAIILVAAVIAVVGFGISLFFKVGYVEVSGTKACKAADIIAASGIQNGDSLFFTGKSTVVRNIMAEQPYVDTVAVKRKLPNIIQIVITESEPVAFITMNGSCWLIDNKGKLLEKKAERPWLPEIKGFKLLAPIEGTVMAVGSDDNGKVESLLQILDILKMRGLWDDVQELSYNAGISFMYQSRFVVKLGIPADIEKKLDALPEVVAVLEPNAEGVIDLTNAEDKIYRFIPS